LVCIAFTALLEESTNPLVNVSIKLVCSAPELPGAVSFEGLRSPIPLASRTNAEIPLFPVCEFGSAAPSLRFLAHEDILEAGDKDGESRALLFSADTLVEECSVLEAGGVTADAGSINESLKCSSVKWKSNLSHL
jgi:hypothetical protein